MRPQNHTTEISIWNRQPRKSVLNEFGFLCLFLPILGFAQKSEDSRAVTLAPLEIQADRLSQPEIFDTSNSGANLSNTLLGGATIAIDDLAEALAHYPGYAAFRKTASRAAHPTTQGIRLRNLGINATSRTLVTLDGVPQNDPFGGWVYWQRYQTQNLESIRIRPSSGSEAWGNFGTGGRISLTSLQPDSARTHIKTTLGTDGGKYGSFTTDAPISSQASINLSARIGETDGFHTLRPDQRGTIDRKAESSVSAYQGQLRLTPNESWTISLKADSYDEDRINGTPEATNGTEANDFSASASYLFDDKSSGIQLLAYSQDRDFHNQFTSVSDDRDSERPVLDQFDMPAEAHGMNLSYFTRFADENELMVGVDFREVDGEVNERFRNLGSGFTRLRKAGGEQSTAGAYVTASLSISEENWIVATARVDEVENSRGFRQEWNTDSGALIRDDRFASSSDHFFSNNVTFYHAFSDNARGMIRHTSGFREPTLNELYRPFRVKNDITEANQNLNTERHRGIEAGIRIGSESGSSLTANLFHYTLDDMIANVVLSREPGFDPLCGFVPGGGSCGQRGNIPESEVEGLEVSWNSNLSDSLQANAQFVYAQSYVTKATAFPNLVGNEFPHASPFRATIALDWQPAEQINAWASIRYQENEYEDLENRRSIVSATLVDCGVSYALSAQHALSARIENLFDSEIETGISSSGLTSIAAPRELWISWDFSL